MFDFKGCCDDCAYRSKANDGSAFRVEHKESNTLTSYLKSERWRFSLSRLQTLQLTLEQCLTYVFFVVSHLNDIVVLIVFEVCVGNRVLYTNIVSLKIIPGFSKKSNLGYLITVFVVKTKWTFYPT